MKAMVCAQYGPPNALQLREIAVPTPGDNQVLIKVYAASVNPMDSFMIRGPLFFAPGIGKRLKPKHQVCGADMAGRVEAVGKNVRQFRPGDDVFGAQGCGGFAEYACAAEDRLALKPANLSFEEAAAVPVAGITALQGLRDWGGIERGQRVAIDGAAGGVGTFAVQIAKVYGAEVTAVCSTRNVEQTRVLGADRVIDYTKEDFTRTGEVYDLIIGANVHRPLWSYRRALRRGGTLVMVGGAMASVLPAAAIAPLVSRMGSRKLRFFIAKIHAKDLNFVKELLESRAVVPVIDRRYALAETAEALRYREEGHARGKVVITVHEEAVNHSAAGASSYPG